MSLKLVFRIAFLVSLISLSACEKEKPLLIPKIYGHAGTTLADERAVFPPNSEESILYALDALNADGIETDVQLTKDSILVIYHNEDLSSNANLSGCVNDFNWNEIATAEYYGNHRILKLSEVIQWAIDRNKLLYLDIKPYNFCAERSIDFEAFNLALATNLEGLSSDQKNKISINCRKFELLAAIEDPNIITCFETENIDLGVFLCQTYGVDKLMIRLSAFDDQIKIKLDNLGINYCISGLKTNAEIKAAALFNPKEVITDNLAATQKYYK